MSETFQKPTSSRIALLSLHIPTVLDQGHHDAEETLASQIAWVFGLWCDPFSGFEMCLSPVTSCWWHVYSTKTASKIILVIPLSSAFTVCLWKILLSITSAVSLLLQVFLICILTSRAITSDTTEAHVLSAYGITEFWGVERTSKIPEFNW